MSARRKGRRAPGKPDPIFALIEAEKAAHAAADRAAAVYDRIADKVPAALTRPPVCERRHNWLFKSEAEAKAHVDRYLPGIASDFGPKTRTRIKRLHGFARAEMVAIYRAAIKAHHAERKRLGLEDADKAMWDANGKHFEAIRRLCRTKPRTRAGLAAFVERLGANADSAVFRPPFDPKSPRGCQGVDLFGVIAGAVASLPAA